MSKTLVIAEKPSVGRDLARVLPGPFAKHEGWLEGPEHVISWAVGHLVQLAEPDEYDPKFKRWRMADLPIVPDRFKLVVRDERSRKQIPVVKNQLHRDDIDEVVNACDAGREGELIFAYLYEQAKAKKPVRRLWLCSMTQTRDAATRSRGCGPPTELQSLEQAARSRSEADWIVGMNATRAATIRLRSSFDGAVSLGRVQTPTLAIVARREQEIRAFKPEPYWLVEATFATPGPEPGKMARASVYDGRYQAPGKKAAAKASAASNGGSGADGEATVSNGNGVEGDGDVAAGNGDVADEGAGATARGPRIASEREALGSSRPCREQDGAITKVEKREQREQRADALRPHLAAARGEHALRLLRPAHACGRAAPLRGAQGAHLPAYELALPGERHGRRDQADRRAGGVEHGIREGCEVRDRARPPAARPRDQRRQGHRPPRDHPDARRAPAGEDGQRRAAHLRPRRAALPRDLPSGRSAGDHARRDDGRGPRVPHERPRARGRGWRGVYGELSEEERERAASRAHGRDASGEENVPAGASRAQRGADDDDEGGPQRLPRLEEGEQAHTREIESAAQGNEAAAALQRRVAARRDGDRGQARRRRGVREAMKDSGIGTPATRAAIIERLIDVGYIEREARSLVATEKGINVSRYSITTRSRSPELTGDWEHRLAQHRAAGGLAQGLHERHRELRARDRHRARREAQGVRIPRANLGPCPVCGRDIVENRKGYSCWSRDDPGCGFVIWKNKVGKQLPASIARELIKTGYTAQQVTGFRNRAGRSFRARLALGQSEDGKWRVEFDEPWAKEGVKPPEETEAETASGTGEGEAVATRSAA